jgi:hypothetical protein
MTETVEDRLDVSVAQIKPFAMQDATVLRPITGFGMACWSPNQVGKFYFEVDE